jgi:CHASE2 domain-containing sensor protein
MQEYPRIVIVGLGKEDEKENNNFHNQRLAAGAGVKALRANGAKSVAVDSSFGNLQGTRE